MRERFIDLIGLYIEVINHSNHVFEGVKGRVIYESENLLHILRDDGKIMKIPKKYVIVKVLDGRYKDNIITYKMLKGSIVRRLVKI